MYNTERTHTIGVDRLSRVMSPTAATAIKVLVFMTVVVAILCVSCGEVQEAPDRLQSPSEAIGVVKQHLSSHTYDIRTAVHLENDNSCESRGGLLHGSTCYVNTQQSCSIIDEQGAEWSAVFVPADRRGNVTRYWEVEVERDAPFLGKNRLHWLVYEKSGRVVSQTEPEC